MDRFRSDMSDSGRTFAEIGRRFKRLLDGQMTRRRIVILFLLVIFFSLYVGPGVLRWLFSYYTDDTVKTADVCVNKYVNNFKTAYAEHDVNFVRSINPEAMVISDYAPYVGNGYFAVTLDYHSLLNVKQGRTVSLPVEFTPHFSLSEKFTHEGVVIDYRDGVVHRYLCSDNGLDIAQKTYAHRTIPSLFVQEFEINNPTDSVMNLKWNVPFAVDWPTAIKQTIKLHHGPDVYSYEVVTGMVEVPKSDNVIAVSIVSRIMGDTIKIDARKTTKMRLLTTVEYSAPVSRESYELQKDIIEKRSIDSMESALILSETQKKDLFEMHSRVWREIWETGFAISDSKAHDTINGDRINATIYTVLSQVRMYEKEERTPNARKNDIVRSLTYSEGCYAGHYTLQAENLWRPLSTLDEINSLVNTWLLTLEKQGCHNLVRAGASGVMQAMVLSFGSLHFSNQHLELKMHPSDLHRNFYFRRINYGNMTHVNISIIVHEDNKAGLYVAVDRSDRNYYACDAGCHDSPVQLGPAQRHFPVKLTNPPTAVLYVTSDRRHMEDLRHAIHVKEVVIAPAHQHHLIALHKHGHTLGGLPAMFWVSICILIVLFHLFLCRIIMTEYCDGSSNYNYRRLYNKP